MGLDHSGLEREHSEDEGQNNYISLVYTADSNTHGNRNGTDVKDTYTLHTSQFAHP